MAASAKKSAQAAEQATPLSPGDERTWAMIAHLSILVNLLSGVLGPVVAIVIYAVFKERSKFVAFQSLQSFVFQMVWWVGSGVIVGVVWAITGLLSAVLIGLCLIPFACALTMVPLAAVIYGVYGAVETAQGHDFRYWLIGDWVSDTLMVRS